MLAATVDAAEKSVARTPTLLAILREAGVVDSGGQGLYRLFQGALLHLVGQAPAAAGAEPRRSPAPSHRRWSPMPTRGSATRRCSCCWPTARAARRRRDPDPPRVDRRVGAGRRRCRGRSRSTSTTSGRTWSSRYGLTLGSLSRISVENLDNQARDVRETRAAAFTGRRPPGAATAARTRRRHGTRLGAGRRRSRWASSPSSAGDGLAAIFRDFGVAGVVQGGQTVEPEHRRAARGGGRASTPARSCSCPTTRTSSSPRARSPRWPSGPWRWSHPERRRGFAALLALDPTLDAAANGGPMTEAARAIQTVVVTEAVRDATIGGKKVKRGQTIALDPDDGLIAVDGDRDEGGPRGDRGAASRATSSSRCSTATARTSPRPRAMAQRIGALAARDRGRGPPRRPALLPVPDLGGVGGAPGRRPRPRPAAGRPGRAARRRRWRASGLGARGAPLRRAGHPARLLRRPRPPVPPAAPLRRPARDAAARRPRLGSRTGRSSRPGSASRDVRVEPTFRRRVQRTIAVLEDETGIDRRDLVRAPLHRAAAPGRRARSSSRAGSSGSAGS